MKQMFWLIALVLVGCTGISQPRYLAPGIVYPADYEDRVGNTLTLVTWNVEHFVDRHDNPYINTRRESEPRISNEKIDLFAKAIRQMNADVVVLQEFESAPYLKELAEKHLDGMGYRFFADAESNNWYQNVVIMSRVPLGVMYGYGALFTPVEFTEDGQSKYQTQDYINTRMWSVELLPNPNYRMILTGLHLKAGRKDRDVAMRKGQIAFLKTQFNRFLKEDKKANLVVVGDLNCTPGSEELELLLSGGKKTGFTDPLEPTVFTHASEDPKRRLDYILFNTHAAREYVSGSAKVAPGMSNGEWEKISDHLPVIADFSLENK